MTVSKIFLETTNLKETTFNRNSLKILKVCHVWTRMNHWNLNHTYVRIIFSNWGLRIVKTNYAKVTIQILSHPKLPKTRHTKYCHPKSRSNIFRISIAKNTIVTIKIANPTKKQIYIVTIDIPNPTILNIDTINIAKSTIDRILPQSISTKKNILNISTLNQYCLPPFSKTPSCASRFLSIVQRYSWTKTRLCWNIKNPVSWPLIFSLTDVWIWFGSLQSRTIFSENRHWRTFEWEVNYKDLPLDPRMWWQPASQWQMKVYFLRWLLAGRLVDKSKSWFCKDISAVTKFWDKIRRMTQNSTFLSNRHGLIKLFAK